MSTIEEKRKIIIESVAKSDNEDLLNVLYNLLHKEALSDNLTESHKEMIQMGLDDVANGRVFSHDQVMNRLQQKNAEWRDA